jgi:Protein of unknown function (DUF2568)
VKVANLALRFLLELAALGALAYWGFHEFDGATAILVGIGAPLAAAIAWGTFVAPRRRVPRGEALRWLVELIVFGAAAAALIDAGAVVLGIAFAVFAVCNGVVVRKLGETPALGSAG